MNDIFDKEKEVIVEAQKLLISKVFSSANDEELYEKLLEEYAKMLKQMRSLVKISDIMQWKLNCLTNEMEQLSNIDGLTGLFNRRFFDEKYQREWINAARIQSPLGILMIDIDYFKKYNDAFGHLQGDKCLQAIANTIKETIKYQHALVARYGGEEFVVLLPDIDLEGCSYLAEKILENIGALHIPSSLENSSEKVSVSIGIGSIIPDKDKELEALIYMADQALYRAKEDGRSCYWQ